MVLTLASSFRHVQQIGGWTTVFPRPDSRIIYCSSSAGSDVNDGLFPTYQGGVHGPKKTASAAMALLRPYFPDHCRFRCGDIFTDAPLYLATLSGQVLSGRGADEPMVLESYGAGPPPKFLATFQDIIIHQNASTLQDVYILGLDAESTTPSTAGWFVRLLGPTQRFFIEGCKAKSTRAFLVMPANTQAGSNQQYAPTIRRCVGEAMYYSNAVELGAAEGALVDTCVFDGVVIPDNSWNGPVGMRQAGVTEVDQFCSGTVVKNCVFAGYRIGTRLIGPGSVEEECLVLQCAHGLQVGNWCVTGAGYSDIAAVGGIDASVRRNLVLELGDLTCADSSIVKGGMGIVVANTLSAEIVDNIVTQNSGTLGVAAGGAAAIRLYGSGQMYPAGTFPAGVHRALVARNRVYGWQSAGSGFSGRDLEILVGFGSLNNWSNVRFEENDIQEPNVSGSQLLGYVDTAVPGGTLGYSRQAQSRANRFYRGGSGSTIIRLGGGSPVGVSAWNETFLEPDSDQSTLTDLSGVYAHPARTAGDFAASIGLANTTAALRAAMKNNRRANWRDELTPVGTAVNPGIIPYFEANLAP